METALSVLKDLPLSKAEQTTFVDKAIEEITSGNVHPVIVDAYLKSMFEVIKKIREDEGVKEYTLDEAEKNGKSFTIKGVDVTVSSRTTKDYSGCGDSVYNDLLAQMESIKLQIKAREAIISSGVNNDTGEVYNPPQTSTSRFLTYKFK